MTEPDRRTDRVGRRAKSATKSLPMGLRWPVERTNSWLSNFGQRRRNTDRKIVHWLAQDALAIAFLLTAKLIDWRNRWLSPATVSYSYPLSRLLRKSKAKDNLPAKHVCPARRDIRTTGSISCMRSGTCYQTSSGVSFVVSTCSLSGEEVLVAQSGFRVRPGKHLAPHLTRGDACRSDALPIIVRGEGCDVSSLIADCGRDRRRGRPAKRVGTWRRVLLGVEDQSDRSALGCPGDTGGVFDGVGAALEGRSHHARPSALGDGSPQGPVPSPDVSVHGRGPDRLLSFAVRGDVRVVAEEREQRAALLGEELDQPSDDFPMHRLKRHTGRLRHRGKRSGVYRDTQLADHRGTRVEAEPHYVMQPGGVGLGVGPS